MTDDTKPESASEPREFELLQTGHRFMDGCFVYEEIYSLNLPVERYMVTPGELPRNKKIKVIEKSAYDRQEKTISDLRAMNTDKANELKRWVDKVLDLEKRLGVAESVGEIQGGFFDCLHPGCCCVCGHSGKCPECGPTAGLSEPRKTP